MNDEPDDYCKVLRAWGTPKQIEQRLIAIDLLLEADKRRKWLYGVIMAIVKAFLAVVMIWGALRLLFGDIWTWLHWLFGGKP